MLILADTPYSDRIPVQIGTTVIDQAMDKVTNEESSKAGTTWCKTIGSTAISGQMKVSETDFDVTSINSQLVTIKCVAIPLFMCKQVNGITKITGHSKQIHVLAQPLDEPVAVGITATRTCVDIWPGLTRVRMMV